MPSAMHSPLGRFRQHGRRHIAAIVVLVLIMASPFFLMDARAQLAWTSGTAASLVSGASKPCRWRGGMLPRRAGGQLDVFQWLQGLGSWGRRSELKGKFLNLIEKSNYGIVPFSVADKEGFDSLVEELSGLSPTPEPARSPLFSGEWKLLWTTEQELLFSIDKGLFGLACTGSTQSIDAVSGTLENRILFEEDSYLRVGSSLAPDEADGKRFNFKFSSCSLKWKNFEVPLPPVGAGWGELVYLDEDLRIQRDSRCAILVASKM
mmetsp:Transcript_15280/g.53722  ORF Transcript_15280/g.53722 Transcript_15280/m.53722 type:complete len:263 (-) Transcript_15280:68-856(-)